MDSHKSTYQYQPWSVSASAIWRKTRTLPATCAFSRKCRVPRWVRPGKPPQDQFRYRSLLKSISKHPMFLQVMKELHGGFRRIGVTEIRSAHWDFPSFKVSSFTGLSCHQKGYGLGKVVESW
jgi:hypothetical protein